MKLSPADTIEFLRLPQPIRADIEQWHAEFETLTGSPGSDVRRSGSDFHRVPSSISLSSGRGQGEGNERACTPVAQASPRGITHALIDIGRRYGVGQRTVERKYSQWRKHGWRGLIDKAKVPSARDQGLPPDFIAEWRRRCEGNQRKCRPAYQSLVRDWLGGKHIPGYEGVPAQDRRRGVPAGWSYANLMRHKPTAFELTAMRRGRAAAADHRPQVFGTRVGLYPGSHYMFDDQWHDNFVLFRGKPIRVLEFDCLDVASACKIDWITKPRYERDDGSFDGLKESQMRLLLAKILAEHGYSQRGTELIAEHGTAAIREPLERLLSDRSGGKIAVRRSGITGEEQAIAGAWAGQGKGNPRFKGALESLRNLIRNRLAEIPGQTGRNTDDRPESLHGQLVYATRLLKLSDRLPARLAADLRFPFLDYETQFCQALLDIYTMINRRTDHELEGWIESGHQIIEYRLSASADQWLAPGEYLGLTMREQQAIATLATADPAAYTRTRLLSPGEVWESGSANSGMTRIPDPVIAEILMGPEGRDTREATVDAGYLLFHDQTIAPGELRYLSRMTDPAGRIGELPAGETYQVVLNPFRLDDLYILDARGGYLGKCKRDHRVNRFDQQSVTAKFAEVKLRESELLAPLRARHSNLSDETLALRRHNLAIAEAEARQAAGTRAQTQLDHRAAKTGAALAASMPSIKSMESTESIDPETEDLETFHIQL